MYKIDTKADKPDIEYMKTQIKELMRKGIKVGKAESLYAEYKGIQDEIGSNIRSEYGILNTNSSKQIVEYMQSLESAEVYEECCIEGKWTSNKEALGNLKELGYQFATDIMNYRVAKKYAEACKTMIDHMDNNRLVHPEVSFGKTNRVNYRTPALMNIPKEILWHLIEPKGEGNTLISADIKNQEPSILINLLGAEDFKDALTDERGLYETLFSKPFEFNVKLNVWVLKAGLEENGIREVSEMAEKEAIPPIYYSPYKPLTDAFYIDGVKVSGIDMLNTVTDLGKEPTYPEKVTMHMEDGTTVSKEVLFERIDSKLLKKGGVHEIKGKIKGLDIECKGIVRKEFKVAWNAMTYGASEFGIKRMCKHIDGKAIYKYFTNIPEFKAYRKQCTALAKNGTQHINTVFGTRLFADEANPKVLKRVLMDLPIQGTGSDILALLINHFNSEVEKRDLVGKLSIYYTRHDELIIEVDKEFIGENGIEYAKSLVNDLLEHQINDWTPFKLEVEEVVADRITALDTLNSDYDE